MKEITIQIPEGKKAVLTFIDETANRPVTERIKTFEDACNELGEKHNAVWAYKELLSIATREDFLVENFGKDVVAYLKLRIIVAALNEGWEPKFTEDEYRYFPWFRFYTEEEYNKLDNEEKERCAPHSDGNTVSWVGFVVCHSWNDVSFSDTVVGSRLALRTSELAIYAGKQFIKEYLDYIC